MTQKTALDFDTLRRANRERARTAEKLAECRSWTAADWMLALTGELGEAANMIKKIRRGDFALDAVREGVGRELADVAIYLDLLADHLGIDLGAVVREKFNEVSVRIGSKVRIEPLA